MKMMKPTTMNFIIIIFYFLSLLSCHSFKNDPGSEDILKNSEIIATRDIVNGDTVITCHLDRLDKDITLSIPLSNLIDSLEIIRLDNADQALIGAYGFCDFSDDHIVVSPAFDGPVILFDREGKFISRLGNLGNGPGEYLFSPWHVQIEEDFNRIYFYPVNTPKIIEYDLKGNLISEIPLAFSPSNGHIQVNPETGRIMVAQIYYSTTGHGSAPPVWIQDFKGNPEWHTYNPIEMMQLSFSNQPLLQGRDRDGFEMSYMRYKVTPDTLYYFDMKNSRVVPRFTATIRGETSWHAYFMTSNYYIIAPMIFDGGNNTWENDFNRVVIVDANTLKGSYCKIYNDFLGGIELENIIENMMHSVDDFNALIEPGDLIDKIEARLSSEDISEDDKELLTKLREGIGLNDNTYILYGKYKKSTNTL